jgi:hypothetical protein
LITLDILHLTPNEHNLLIVLEFSNDPSQTKKSNNFNRLAPLTKKPNEIKNLAQEPDSEPEVRPNELRFLMSGIMTIVVSIVVKGLMTIVVNAHSDYSENPLESIVVSHESLDYSSESECVVVIE